MAKSRALGRGLNSLIPNAPREENLPPREVLLSLLEPNPDQPRNHMQEEPLDSLAESIRRHGILQPLLVRPFGNGFRIVAGERRWRAASRAGLEKVPVHVLPGAEEKDLELALLENVQREDLSPLEVAEALEKLVSDHSMTQEKAAAAMGWSRPAVANKLRLLQLPGEVRLFLAEGRLTEGHCRALLGLENHEVMVGMAKRAATTGASVRQLEEWVRRAGPRNTKEERLSKDDPLAGRCEDISRKLGLVISLTGKGKRRKLTLSRLDDGKVVRLLDLLDEKSEKLFPGK
jgi:ParB family chromosome partitioning protein